MLPCPIVRILFYPHLHIWDANKHFLKIILGNMLVKTTVQSMYRSTKVFPTTKASESWGSMRMYLESSCLPSCSSTATKPWWPCRPVTGTSRLLPVMLTSPGLGKKICVRVVRQWWWKPWQECKKTTSEVWLKDFVWVDVGIRRKCESVPNKTDA